MDVKLRRLKLVELSRAWEGKMAVRDKPSLRPMAIDELLRWAYVQELPKTPRAPVGPGGESGTMERVEMWQVADNGFGCVPDFFAADLPHDDAVLVHEAVCRLDECLLTLPDDWSPMQDLGDLGGLSGVIARHALDAMTTVDDDGVRRLRRTPRRLVMKHALLGGAPDWRIDAPEILEDSRWFVVETVRSETLTGFVDHDVEVCGFDEVARGPKPGAYHKVFLQPDPRDGVVSRAEYEVWRAAMDVLFEDLRGTLASIEALGCALPMRPWEEVGAVARVVLPDLRVGDLQEVRGGRKKIARNA